jgi:cytochrome c
MRPFRTLHTRYPIEDLAEASRKASRRPPLHAPIQFDPAQINDLLAYLDAIQG